MKFDIQKASISKRISAFLFDFIITGTLIVGIGFLMSKALHYDNYVDKFQSYYNKYEKEYGVKFEMTKNEFEAMSPDKQKNYENAYSMLINDKDAILNYNIIVNDTLLIMSISTLLGFLILEFIVPICLKNGQTFGKKIFGVGVMHTSGIRITPILLFIRTILGKYTLETMVPLLIITMIFFNTIGLLGTVILGLILLLQIILVIVTPTNSLLHDILARTVAVDLASQKIFKDGAELLEYKKKMHAEEVSRADY